MIQNTNDRLAGRFAFRRIAFGAILAVSAAGALLAGFSGYPFTASPALMPMDRVALPNGAAKGVVFLLSDASGWGQRDEGVSAKLRADGVAVVGVDTPKYLSTIKTRAMGCAYLISDIERVAQQIQRDSGSKIYVAPVIVGTGLGGGLALDMIDQTPEVTVGGTVVVDPQSAVPFPTELCTPAGYLTVPGGEIYALHGGHEPDPVSVLLSPEVSGGIRDRVTALKAASSDVALQEGGRVSEATLVSAIEGRIAKASTATGALPVTVLNAVAKRDTMAVILSGDGGWRDIDASIGKLMQADGVPVVGVDSLRYFWRTRTPEETARDVAGLIERYRSAWGVRNVMIIGYSFGADVLPATYRALPEDVRSHVRLIGLLGLSKAADWRITVAGWFGAHGAAATDTLTDAARLPLSKVFCVYGKEEPDTACPALGRIGSEFLSTDGGHHFAGNYAAVERALIAAYETRTVRESISPQPPALLAQVSAPTDVSRATLIPTQ